MGKDMKTKVENLPVVEVKRPARTGEYIKALKDSEHGRYRQGDILLVTDGNFILIQEEIQEEYNYNDFIDYVYKPILKPMLANQKFNINIEFF
jgi:chromosomal replication initiation ATPase DnaA